MKQYFKEILNLWNDPMWYLTILISSIILLFILELSVVGVIIGFILSMFMIAGTKYKKKKGDN